VKKRRKKLVASKGNKEGKLAKKSWRKELAKKSWQKECTVAVLVAGNVS
jgi:hypothetical protein